MLKYSINIEIIIRLDFPWHSFKALLVTDGLWKSPRKNITFILAIVWTALAGPKIWFQINQLNLLFFCENIGVRYKPRVLLDLPWLSNNVSCLRFFSVLPKLKLPGENNQELKWAVITQPFSWSRDGYSSWKFRLGSRWDFSKDSVCQLW